MAAVNCTRPDRASCTVRARCQRGSALLLVLVCVAGLAAGVGLLVPLAITERLLALASREAAECRYAAEAAVVLAMAELRVRPSWDGALRGTEPSSFRDATRRPTLSGSRVLDLDSVGASLPGWEVGTWGADEPRWELFAWGHVRSLSPALRSPVYVAVWAADDERDGDGDPGRDANGRLRLRAEAFGPLRGRRAVAVSVARRLAAPTPLRVLDWRLR